MMIDLSRLQPSTQAPIPIETLRGLPLGGLYLVGDDRISPATAFLREWDDERQACMGLQWVAHGETWLSWHNPRMWEIRYPRISRVAFSMTIKQISTPGDQPSGRCKSVTRRKKAPTWAKTGALFLAIDQGRRSKAQAPSRGLGVFRVVTVETVGRWRCSECKACLEHRADCYWSGPKGPWTPSGLQEGALADTLTPEELALEGFPDMPPDDFWQLLAKAGNVAEDGTCCRLSFEAATP